MANGAVVDVTNNKGHTALHPAAHEGNIRIIEILLSHGADINVKDKINNTPLFYAMEAGHKDVVELLTKHLSRRDTN